MMLYDVTGINNLPRVHGEKCVACREIDCGRVQGSGTVNSDEIY